MLKYHWTDFSCVSLFGSVNNITIQKNYSNNGDRAIEFGLFDDSENDEYNGVGFEEITYISAMREAPSLARFHLT